MPDPFVQTLRRRMSQAEKALWQCLRNRHLHGYKFRRQFRVGVYVVDFVCLEKRIVIECDGPHHDSQKGYDRQRDAWLVAQGFVVVRIDNDALMNQGDAALDRIRKEMTGEN